MKDKKILQAHGEYLESHWYYKGIFLDESDKEIAAYIRKHSREHSDCHFRIVQGTELYEVKYTREPGYYDPYKKNHYYD